MKIYTPEEVRSFMGLANYYRRFVKGFAHIASPLHGLREKGRPFNWTAEYTTAFTELKSKLCTAPILAYPNITGITCVANAQAHLIGRWAVTV